MHITIIIGTVVICVAMIGGGLWLTGGWRDRTLSKGDGE